MGTELFPLCFSLVSLCLSPRWALLQPHHSPSPPWGRAPVPGGLLRPRPPPAPGTKSSCWASGYLPDPWMPPPGPQPPWPGARRCCPPQAQRRGGTVPARRAAQRCAGWDEREGVTSRTLNYDCFPFFFWFVLLQIIAIANCSFLERRSWTWAFASLKAR